MTGEVPLFNRRKWYRKKLLLAKELSRINNYHLVTIDGNLLKEGEIGGLPMVEKKEILFKGDVVKKA